MILPVAEVFEPYVASALVRLGYLYPDARFVPVANGIEITTDGADHDVLAREVQYALYREKIYAETLPLRQSLIDAVTHR